jgi:hypothetical protein
MAMVPFTGVLADHEDRGRLVMWLDALRALIIVTVAIPGLHCLLSSSVGSHR